MTSALASTSSLRRLQVVVVNRPVEGRHAVGLGLVQVDAAFGEGANGRTVLLLGRIGQGRLRGERD